MQTFATETITRTALAAGLPEGRIINLAKKDNLTIERPRIEIQFLPEKYTRTGRKLAVTRTKTELVNANILADDRAWLEAFAVDFVAGLPRGGNDSRGNWVKIRVQKATFGRAPDKRVGDEVIEVFTKVNRLFVLTFTGRITEEETEEMIPSVTINKPTFK